MTDKKPEQLDLFTAPETVRAEREQNQIRIALLLQTAVERHMEVRIEYFSDTDEYLVVIADADFWGDSLLDALYEANETMNLVDSFFLLGR